MDFLDDPITGNQPLFKALQQGAFLLTVNNRLARRIATDYNDFMAQQGLNVWPTPQILPIRNWLEEQVKFLETHNGNAPRFLGAAQEKLLWTQILEPDAYQVYMMPATSIARPVMQAWQLMQQWQVPLEALESYETPETQSLLRWSGKFDQQCLKNNWQSSTGIYQYVTDALAEEQKTIASQIPAQIIIAGFEDPNRLHQQLFKQLQSLARISEYIVEKNNNASTVVQANDFDEEILAAANWARQKLLEDSNQKLAVVIPSLQENRSKVERCFNLVLHPERSGPPPYHRQSLFNLSLGKPLTDYALINQALASLKLLSPIIQTNDLLNLIQAPYLFGSTENEEELIPALNFSQRSFIDSDLRRAGRLRWTLKALLHRAKTHSSTVMSENWSKRLDLLVCLFEQTTSQRSPEDWVSVFLEAWKIVGWPGEQALDSHEYQQSERLKKLLADFGHLQTVQPQMSFAEAASQLKRLCQDTVFQEQSETAPLLVAGLLEAADQSFDAIWVTGLDDQTLPAQTAPNPFIPLAIQKQYNLPHSSAEREYRFAQKLLSQFCAYTDEVIFSYPKKEGDSDLRPSTLLEQFEQTTMADLIQIAEAMELQSVELETESISSLPALPEHSLVQGGTRVLDLEAQCPFRANTEIRLKANQPDDLTEGTPPMLWGSQIHKVLEACWKQIDTLQTLQQMETDKLTALIKQQIDLALEQARHDRPDLYRPNYLSLEKQRMLEVLLNWFELEKNRTEDFKIAGLEQQQNISIGKIQLSTRIDRIDQLSNGQKIVLDYKTGLSSSSKSWIAEQIAEPQLPLYSLALESELAALAFAKVHEKQCSFDGLAQQDDILPGVKALHISPKEKPDDNNNDAINPDWLPLQAHWQQSLNELAESYRLGESFIDNSNCLYCDKAALCRHHELHSTNRVVT